MTIEQRGKSFRVKQMYKGKMYSVTLDHKPTKKEATILMAELFENKTEYGKGTLGESIDRYLESKSNVLSVTTIGGYKAIKNNMQEWFVNTNLYDIDRALLQEAVNGYAADHSPKSARNMASFCKTVITFYRPNFSCKIQLPQMVKEEPYIPKKEEVQAILKEAKGTMYECAFRLSVYGLRKGEIAAIDSSCVDGNILHISQSVARPYGGGILIKTTKTTKSKRDIFIDDELAALIKSQGKAFNGHPDSMLREFHRLQRKLGLPKFKLHAMRHYFCTELSEAGFSEQAILDLGGWETSKVMERVYRHSRIKEDTEQKKKAMEILTGAVE